MSGVGEASLVLGMISAIISIIEATKEVYEAVEDEAGLPKNFKKSAAKLPLISKILEDAEAYISKVDEKTKNAFKPTLENCQIQTKQLQELFVKVMPEENDSRWDRYVKAARTIGKGGRIETLIGGILDDLQLLTTRFPEVTTARGKEQLAKAVEEVSHMEPSLPDDFDQLPAYVHFGSGPQNNNTGSGIQHNNSGTGNQNSGSGQMFIGTNSIVKNEPKFSSQSSTSYGNSIVGQYVIVNNHSREAALREDDRLMQGLQDLQVAVKTQYIFLYPSHRVLHYVPRKGPLEAIHKQFQMPPDKAAPTIVVLLGMGGCGKSQLALEYCRLGQNEKWFSAILWLDASSPASVARSFADVAHKLSKPNFDIGDDKRNIQFMLDTIEAWQIRWLLIFDNFDDPNSFGDVGIKHYFPRGGYGSILFTSRHAVTKNLGYYIEVTTMSDEEALQLLLKRSQVKRTDTSINEGANIVKRLGYHALAIDQAGAYILARGLDLDAYMTHYSERKEKVLKEVPELWDYRRRLKTDEEVETKLTVFTTWELSMELISGSLEARQDKVHILTLAGFLDGKEVSDDLFKCYGASNLDWLVSCVKDGAWDKYEAQDILKELQNLSLLQNLDIGKSKTTFSLHPLIQDWVKLRVNFDTRRTYALEAILVLSVFLEDESVDDMNLSMKQTLLSHLDIALQNDREYTVLEDNLEEVKLLDAASRFGLYFESQGRYKSSKDMIQHAFKGREKVLGKEHPHTLISMNNLAFLLRSQGEYDAAEPIYRETLQLREKILGKEHPDTLTSMNNLAYLLQSQGKYDAAEPIYRETLQLTEKVLGKEHPDTLRSMNNLAYLLQSQGEYDAAEPIYRETLQLTEKVLGKEHPDTLISMNNFASLLESQGEYDAAEPIYRETLQLREKVLGKEHPDTLRSMNNLAYLLQSQGEYDAAEPIYRETLQLTEKVLGKEHPDTLISMNNLAFLLRSQGEYDAAEPIYRETLQLREKILGKEHPDTLGSMNNFASLLESQGEYDAAEPIYRETLQLREKVLGKNHPNTIGSIFNLATVLKHQGNIYEARILFQEELNRCILVYGLDHTETLESRRNLASFNESYEECS